MGWFWSSKEENVQKNLQNHIDRLNVEVKTLETLNKQDNTWVTEVITILQSLITKNRKTLDFLIKKKTGDDSSERITTQQVAQPLPQPVPQPDAQPDAPNPTIINVGGTRKRRKNKKHKKNKKKTLRH